MSTYSVPHKIAPSPAPARPLGPPYGPPTTHPRRLPWEVYFPDEPHDPADRRAVLAADCVQYFSGDGFGLLAAARVCEDDSDELARRQTHYGPPQRTPAADPSSGPW